MDVPRLIEGRVALQVLSMAVKTPRGLNIERNDDTSDEVLKLALAKRWPPATWRRLLPRVLHLAARAHGFAARSGGRVPVIRPATTWLAYLAAHAADPRDHRRRCSRSRARTRSTATRPTSTSWPTPGSG